MISEINEIKITESEIDEIINNFLNEYSITETPIEVSFRALVKELPKPDRFTHLIHSYPAKLLMHIPYFFLNNNIFSKPGSKVLDPFCGTGTVLLESILSGRNSIGADANPLARLIARVKTTDYSINSLNDTLANILSNIYTDNPIIPYPDVVNIDYWFNEKNKKSLLILLSNINVIDDELIKDFFLVCFSNLIKKVSYADPRINVPVRLNAKRYVEGSANYKKVKKRLEELELIDVFVKFESICRENISRFVNLKDVMGAHESKIHAYITSKDARNITMSLDNPKAMPNDTVDLIITSPPYAGAQKYIRSSSLNLGWLGLAGVKELKDYDKLNIGRENYTKSEFSIKCTNIAACDLLIDQVALINPLRAQIISNYIIEMKTAIEESIRVLKPGGYFILIVGNNKVCDLEFNTQDYLSTFMQSRGLKLILKLIDDIKSYGLMTKRNKTADIISREWVLVFKKEFNES